MGDVMLISEITVDKNIQLDTRGIDNSTVAGYVEAMASGDQFPPVVVFSQNGDNWLADGFHRIAAARFMGYESIDADSRPGTWEDAAEYAAIANADERGKQMTLAQKREAVIRLLKSNRPEWTQAACAKRFAVGASTVRDWWASENRKDDNDNNWRVHQKESPPPSLFSDNLVRGPIGSYRILHNGVKKCEKCGELWAADLDYCPYCHISQGARVLHVQREKTAHVSHNAGNNEWYTPQEYIDAARQVMGGIDLDPASSDTANATVCAGEYYTTETNGLAHGWHGRVWMNPPYSQPAIAQFSEKLQSEVDTGSVDEAIVLVNNATETGWFQGMLKRAAAVCFPSGRVKFIDEQGNPGAPLQGQALLYFGDNAELFRDVFEGFGVVLWQNGGK